MFKKIVVSTLILALIGGLTYWYFIREEKKPINYRFEQITRGDIKVLVTATGSLSAVQTVQVGTQVSGTILKLFTDFNDKVKTGQIVAQIDPTFLEAQVRDAQANLQRTSAQLNEAKRNFRRVKTLLEKKLAPQSDYDKALAEFETSDALKKQSEAQLERTNINLRYATIRSPIDGVVISRQVDVGQTVAASFASPTLFTIANDLTKMQVQASVDEADIGKVQVGQSVTFTVDSYPEQEFIGTVKQVRLSPSVVQNVVTYTVIIDVPNEELKLMPGMTATVSILIEEQKNVLKVPTLALRFQPSQDETEIDSNVVLKNKDSLKSKNKNLIAKNNIDSISIETLVPIKKIKNSKIWILNSNNKLVSIQIKTGLVDGTFTEIFNGTIKEGDEVVVGVVQDKIEKSVNPFNPSQQRGGSPRRM
ncbi:MAG: efflux RND transporter periplasmic adaptor subunit [Bacteroidota bacterium]